MSTCVVSWGGGMTLPPTLVKVILDQPVHNKIGAGHTQRYVAYTCIRYTQHDYSEKNFKIHKVILDRSNLPLRSITSRSCPVSSLIVPPRHLLHLPPFLSLPWK